MKSEAKLKAKMEELKKELKRLEGKLFTSRSADINIEFLKNNITFIKWALDKPICECNCSCHKNDFIHNLK